MNVSPLSLGSAEFRAVMASTIARLREEGLRLVLVLELTEQALLEHHETIREIHRDHGVTFAVDDFGTGYSSLRTVSDLAVSRVVSVLKIDGSLTRRIADSAEAYKVVLAVAHLAKSLDLRVIAERVETPEVLERLRTTGIECGQGFLSTRRCPPASSSRATPARAGPSSSRRRGRTCSCWSPTSTAPSRPSTRSCSPTPTSPATSGTRRRCGASWRGRSRPFSSRSTTTRRRCGPATRGSADVTPRWACRSPLS